MITLAILTSIPFKLLVAFLYFTNVTEIENVALMIKCMVLSNGEW